MNSLKHLKLDRVEGPLVILSDVSDVGYNEVVHITVGENDHRKGKVVLIDHDRVVLQVFEGTQGMSVENSSVAFSGKSMSIPVSKNLFGRIFNGVGEPIDGVGFYSDRNDDIVGRPLTLSHVYIREITFKLAFHLLMVWLL
jgi:V/A-type H+-transporting ATPase subunit B